MIYKSSPNLGFVWFLILKSDYLYLLSYFLGIVRTKFPIKKKVYEFDSIVLQSLTIKNSNWIGRKKNLL